MGMGGGGVEGWVRDGLRDLSLYLSLCLCLCLSLSRLNKFIRFSLACVLVAFLCMCY